MDIIKNIIPLSVLLFICTLNGYSMMSYRLPAKKSYGCFAAVTVLCFVLNSYIIIRYGKNMMRNIMIFTIGLPYFVLILLITKDKISQTVFNFWLWINVYEMIANISAFIDDYIFHSYYCLTILRLVLFAVYFIVYNKYLKMRHRALMEMLDVNWWFFSFIPMCFTLLISTVNYYFSGYRGFTRNYTVLFVIHILMLFVYALIFYTFKTAYESSQSERLAQSMREQVALQKKQYEFYLGKAETERIFRHDARHRDAILMNYLENKDIDGAREFLKKEVDEIKLSKKISFCENMLVNAVVTEYYEKAIKRNIEFSAHIQMPEEQMRDEIEFCVMLSNLLENSLEAAKSCIVFDVKCLNRQISVNIKNDYDGKTRKDMYGDYLTTKKNGSGLGLKSVRTIIANNGGFLKIDDKDGVFNVYATMKNQK